MPRSTCTAALLSLLPLMLGGVAHAEDSDAQSAQVSPQPQPASQQPALPRVTVVGTQTPESNYRVETVDSLGPLGSTKILDAPYSITILPLDLIENSQAVNFKDVSKYLPLVAYQEQQGPDILRPQTRGMQGGNFQNSRMDGMTMFVTVANALEQFQQIEVLNGVSASLYGPANPSGMFNFVSKRPTDYDLRRVSVAYDSNGIGTAHVDLGGRIDAAGVLSYRLNGVFGEGTGYVDGSHTKRVLGDLGVDIRPARNTVVELNYSDYHLINHGYPGWFTYGEKIDLPSAPDPTRVGLGQTYAGIDLETRMGSVRLKQDINSNWHLVVGALNQDALRDINTPVNNLKSNAGNYVSSFGNGFAPRFVMTSDAGYLNGDFSTGVLAHDLTLGTAGYKSQSYSVTTAPTAASVLLGSANINNPQTYPEPAAGPPATSPNFDSSTTYQQGVNVGDTIRFSDAWSTRLAVSQDWFHVDNYNAKAKALPEYSNSGASPTASLMFKPINSVTTYVTYASSLQAGDLAPGTPGAPGAVANAGQSLPAYRSKEIEAGVKASLASIDYTAAIFRIQRPFANIDLSDNLFEISGEQVNKGLELSAVGEIVSGLTVYEGVTVLNARLEDTGVASTNDKVYVGAPKFKGNMLLEYRIPGMERLVAVFDWQFSSARPGNDTNSFYAAGYNLFDLGARYSSNWLGKNVTWRVAVNNVTDKSYWSTIAPSNLTGTNTGNLVAHLGAPRTVLASASFDF
jgi:iron complex outermembrane receptor protein